MPDRDQKKTLHGIPVTDELLDKLAGDAEAGYDVDEILRRRRRRGRPSMGTAAASVESVRLDPELHKALRALAERESVSSSEVIRKALRIYIGVRAVTQPSRTRKSPELIAPYIQPVNPIRPSISIATNPQSTTVEMYRPIPIVIPIDQGHGRRSDLRQHHPSRIRQPLELGA